MANEQMEFPGTWEEYEKDYGFNDSKEVYTNNSRLIPSFRVKQWLDHLPSIQPTTKENLVVEDCIRRAEAIDALGYDISIESDEGLDAYKTVIKEMLCKIYDVQKENIEKLPSIKPKTDVLDKIRAEIHATAEMHEDGDYYLRDEWIDKIIDKYKAESEIHCNCTDAEIAKSFIEDVEAVKELLPQDESEDTE